MESWYEIAQGAELRQGSLLRVFPVVKPPKNVLKTPDGKWQPSPSGIKEQDIIVLSQSCDLVQNSSGLVLIAPVALLNETNARAWVGGKVIGDEGLFLKFKEQIRRGQLPPLHLLAPCDIAGVETDIQVVDFRQAATVSFAHLQTFASQTSNHLRLRPPFREHLSQAYARFMMRVALEKEAEIPPFSPLP